MMIFNAVEKLHYSYCKQTGPNMVLCEIQMKTGMEGHKSLSTYFKGPYKEP